MIPVVFWLCVTGALACTSIDDCNNGHLNTLSCAICSESSCVNPFQDVFGYLPSSGKCLYKDHCQNKPCKFGKCVNGFGGPVCICTEGYYGSFCDLSTSYTMGALTSGVYYKYPWVVSMGARSTIHVMVESIGSKPELTVRYGVGGLLRLIRWISAVPSESTKDKCESPRPNSVTLEYRRTCRYHFYLNIRFPYYNMKSVISSGVLQGYLTKVKVILRNKIGKDIIVTQENSFDVFVKSVNEPEHHCSCKIQLLNCGKTLENPVIYYRYSNIRIESDFYFYSDGLRPNASKSSDIRCKDESKLKWKLWRIDPFIYHDELESKPSLSLYEDSIMSFKPYSIEYGLYKVLLEVKYLGIAQTLSFAWCYFRIDIKGILLVLDQGDHTVVITDGIHLSASEPTDWPKMSIEKSRVQIKWICLTIWKSDNKRNCTIKPKILQVFQSYDIEPELLEPDSKYTFESHVLIDYDPRLDRESTRQIFGKTIVTVVRQRSFGGWIVKCLKNCGSYVIVNEYLILIASDESKNFTERDFITWDYRKEGSMNERVPESMMILGYPSNILILKEGALEVGTSYEISAKHPSKLVMPYFFQTTNNGVFYNGSCSVDPPEGQKGVTEFDITCDLVPGTAAYQFEFYDKYEADDEEGAVYSGRMLGTSFSGNLLSVILTRDIVMVYIVNEIGLSVSQKIYVQLSECNVTLGYLLSIKKNLENLLKMGEVQKILRYISFVSDVFKPEFDREEMLIDLLGASFQLSISDINEAKLATSAVKNIVIGLTKGRACHLSMMLIQDAMKRIYKTTEVLATALSDIGPFESGQRKKYISPSTVKHVTTHILDTVYFILLCANKNTYDIDEDFEDFGILMHLQQSTKYAEIILEFIHNILKNLEYSVVPANISSKDQAYSIWVVMNHVDFSLLEVLKIYRDIPISITHLLMQDLLKMISGPNDKLTLQVSECKQNIAWWSRGNVKSNIITVAFIIHNSSGKFSKIYTLENPVYLLFSLWHTENNKLTSGVLEQLEIYHEPVEIDLNVKVFRLDLPPATYTEIVFPYPPNKGSWRVMVIKERFRPDYEMMTKHSTIINKTSSVVAVKTYIYDDESVYYLGILPGLEDTKWLEFTFQLNTIRCQHWTRGRWVGEGCEFKKYSAIDRVICSCNHLSIFSIGGPIASDTFEQIAEYKMLLTIQNNYLIIVVSSLLLLLYSISGLWAVVKDKNDKCLRIVTILRDNYPCDQNAYLVSVWTSSRFNAGTTAHVAIKLHGDGGVSRVHILFGNTCTVLRRNTDNWFLILCPKPLGNLFFLQVWHDNYGKSPDWFCNKICVYDINNKVEYVFPVDQWVALRLDKYPEIIVLPVYIEDLTNMKKTFIKCFKHGMQERHLITSIFLRHARSSITRLERVTILLCCVMIALSWSVFIYQSITHPGIDDWSAKLQMRDFVIALQIILVNIIFLTIITVLFRKKVKFTCEQAASKVMVRSQFSTDVPLMKTQGPKRNNVNEPKKSLSIESIYIYRKSVFQRFVKAFYSIKMTREIPVNFPSCKPYFEIRKMWLFAAWSAFFAITILSFLFVVFWSLGLGYNQSKKCLSCALLGICAEILFFGPLAILVISLLFAIGLDMVVDFLPHCINRKDLNQYKKLNNNNAHYINLINLRGLPMYKPINVFNREKNLFQLFNRWSIVIEFFISFTYVIGISSIALRLWTSQFYPNLHSAQMFNFSHSTISTIDYFDVKTISQMETYLLGTFMRAVYLLRWYNGQVISSGHGNLNSHCYRMSDYTSKMIGKPLIRQLRVRPRFCSHMMAQDHMKCVPTYSSKEEDKGIYGIGWTAATWSDRKKEYSPWQYNDRSISWFLKQDLYGAMSKDLDYGGYMVYLSPNRYDSIMTITELMEQAWLDRLTKAVIIEVTIYNVNQQLFSHITMIVAIYDDTLYFHNIQVFSVPGRRSFNQIDLLCIVILVFFMMTTVKAINKHGLMQYLSRLKNILKVLVIILSNMILVLLVLHFYSAKAYVINVETITIMDAFDFDRFVYPFTIAKFLCSFLLLAAIFQLLCLIQAGRLITCCVFAFVLSLQNTLILLSILVTFIVIQWRFLAFLLNTAIYHSVIEPFTKCFLAHNNYTTPYQQGTKLVFIVTCLFIKLIILLFGSIFLHFIRSAKQSVTQNIERSRVLEMKNLSNNVFSRK